MNIIVIAYQLHYSAGSEYAVAMDYVTHMSKSNKLTVLYGTCSGHHSIGNTAEMELYTDTHPMDNVTFVPVKPSFKSRNCNFSIIGNYYFYKQYKRWHQDVRKIITIILKDSHHYDCLHYLGPIGYHEPGFLTDLGLPCIWGPIGGFGSVSANCIKPSYLLNGGIQLLIKGLINKLQEKFSFRIRKAVKEYDSVICSTSIWKKTVEAMAGKHHHSIISYKPENCINNVYPLNKEKFKSDTIKLIYVGKLDCRKALYTIIDALAMLPKNNPIKLYVLGQGPLEDKLKKQASDLGVSHMIEWIGKVPRNQVFEYMNDSHLLVIPSLMDANTTIIWEAMAMGLPSLALDHFGFHDTIIDMKTGFLIKPTCYRNVINDISSRLNDVIKNPYILRKMANEVIIDRQKYLWEDRILFFEKIYKDSITNHNNKL